MQWGNTADCFTKRWKLFSTCCIQVGEVTHSSQTNITKRDFQSTLEPSLTVRRTPLLPWEAPRSNLLGDYIHVSPSSLHPKRQTSKHQTRGCSHQDDPVPGDAPAVHSCMREPRCFQPNWPNPANFPADRQNLELKEKLVS